MGGDDPSLRGSAQKRKLAGLRDGADQVVGETGNECGLARSAEPGDREPNRAITQKRGQGGQLLDPSLGAIRLRWLSGRFHRHIEHHVGQDLANDSAQRGFVCGGRGGDEATRPAPQDAGRGTAVATGADRGKGIGGFNSLQDTL